MEHKGGGEPRLHSDRQEIVADCLNERKNKCGPGTGGRKKKGDESASVRLPRGWGMSGTGSQN